MLIKAQRAMVSDVDRDQVLADRAWELVKSGPFGATVRVETPSDTDTQSLIQILGAAGIDDARKTRLVVLDPAGSVFSTESTRRLGSPSEPHLASGREAASRMGVIGHIRLCQHSAP